MRKQVQLWPVEILLDPGVPGADAQILRPLDNAAGFWQPNDFDEVGHVAHQVVVHALLVENENAVDLKPEIYHWGGRQGWCCRSTVLDLGH